MTEDKSDYVTTIGIECHVQLKTRTKLFSAVGNDAREAPPNTLVSHIDFGLPGALPVLNEAALQLAVKAAFALGTEPERFSKFDRKHYFYPDLPKGYQISQYDQPIIGKGSVTIMVNDQTKVVGITRAHLEEDAGKSSHPVGTNYSLVDLNRAGTPLLEIVSEPDMHSSAEAKAYAHELYLRMRYAEVSEADLYYGNMRFDVNVSVSKTTELGTRTETKNLNSFRSIEKAVDYEVARQIARLEKGETIIQETRGWDDTKQQTFSQRSKENADDYRYMPDPDIPPIILDERFIAEIKKNMPALPDDYRAKFAQLGIDKRAIEDIISNRESAETVGRILEVAGSDHARRIAFWLMLSHPNDGDSSLATTARAADVQLIKLSQMVADNSLSSTAAKEVLAELINNGGDALTIATEKNLIQMTDNSAIAAIVVQVLAANPQAATDVQNGEAKAIGFLVGQVMKLSQGKANPSIAQQLIREELAK